MAGLDPGEILTVIGGHFSVSMHPDLTANQQSRITLFLFSKDGGIKKVFLVSFLFTLRLKKF